MARELLNNALQTPAQILKTSPECKDAVNTFGVSYTYLQQIADLDLAVE